MQRLLVDLMDDLRRRRYPTAFTLARARVPGMNEWDARVADSDISRVVDAGQEANREEFMSYVQQRLGAG